VYGKVATPRVMIVMRAKGGQIARFGGEKETDRKHTKLCMLWTAILPSRAYYAKEVRRISFLERKACFGGVEADLIDVVVCMPTFLFPPLQDMRSYPRRLAVARSPKQNVLGP